MPEHIYKTQYGTFKVGINDDIKIDFDTRIPIKIGTLLSIGGANTCVFFSIPNDKDTAHLVNLKTKGGGCELTGKLISGQNTIGMVNLGLTIIRKIAPHIQFIRLEDMSDFPCKMENGKEVGISMIFYSLVLYQQSYYEKRFGAYLKNEVLRTMYEEYKSGFEDPLPTNFSFNNRDLEILLRPFYEESTNWKEFFQKVSTLPNVCQVLFSWYRTAIMIIFKGVSFERQEWIIDLYNNPSLILVEYTEDKLTQKGGKRKTRKQVNYSFDLHNSDKYYDKMTYDEIYNLKYIK
jgi:hypothetical protein